MEKFRWMLGFCKAPRVVEVGLEALMFVLNTEGGGTSELKPEEIARTGSSVTCYVHVGPM